MPTNRVKIGLPLYLNVEPWFFQSWMRFQNQIAKAQRDHLYAGLLTTEMGYVHRAANTIVDWALSCGSCKHEFSVHDGVCKICREKKTIPSCMTYEAPDDFDYLLLIEQDNIIPEGWIDRIQTYDPTEHPIVGLMYFGKVAEDMRPVPGLISKTGSYDRLRPEQCVPLLNNPGLYPMDWVGMGATAIHRSVLLKWAPERMPWFQTREVPPNGFMGQDIHFCRYAKEQGWQPFVDTTLIAGHVGPWISDDKSYRTTVEWNATHQAPERHEADFLTEIA